MWTSQQKQKYRNFRFFVIAALLGIMPSGCATETQQEASLSSGKKEAHLPVQLVVNPNTIQITAGAERIAISA